MFNNKRLYLLLGFVLIAIIYSLYNLYLVDVNYYEQIPRKFRHVFRFLCILLVYLAGYYALKKYWVNWIRVFWNIAYMVVVPLILLIGIYDWTLGPVLAAVRNIANSLQEFLISPVFYASLLIVHQTFVRITKKQKV